MASLRTGSVGNRNVDDIVNTLPAPKKGAVSQVRNILLDLEYIEEMEYDAVNVEPVLTYSRSEDQLIVLRYKWEVNVSISLKRPEILDDLQKTVKDELANFLVKDDEGDCWLKFSLPEQQESFFSTLRKLFP